MANEYLVQDGTTGDLLPKADVITDLGISDKAPLASPTFTGIVTVPTPSNDTDASTKAYVDAVAQGLAVKPSAIVATTAALPTFTYLSGVITATAAEVVAVDGHDLVLNDIVLVKNEVTTNAPYNGLYSVTTAGEVGVALVMTRHSSMNSAAEFPGAFVFVETGTVNAANGFVCTNSTNPTVGVTDIVFAQFSGAGQITAGAALTKSGNTLDVAVDGSTIEVSSDALRVKDAGITLAKMDNMATAALIYRKTAGAGVPEVNTLATLKTDLGLTGTNSGDQTVPTASATVTAETSYGAASDAGTATTFSKGDHTHGTPASTKDTTAQTGILKGNGSVISAAANTDLPVGDATHSGAMPTPPNNTTTFLRGDATFATPTISSTAGVGNTPTATGTVTITHNLGRTPVVIRIQSAGGFTSNAAATPTTYSMGIWNSSGNFCIYQGINGTTTLAAASSNAFSIYMITSAGNLISGVIQNVGATTFDIAFTETGTHTRGVYMWETQ